MGAFEGILGGLWHQPTNPKYWLGPIHKRAIEINNVQMRPYLIVCAQPGTQRPQGTLSSPKAQGTLYIPCRSLVSFIIDIQTTENRQGYLLCARRRSWCPTLR